MGLAIKEIPTRGENDSWRGLTPNSWAAVADDILL
jgi:hypothetical protein